MGTHEGARLGIDLGGEVGAEDLLADLLERHLRGSPVGAGGSGHEAGEARPTQLEAQRA